MDMYAMGIAMGAVNTAGTAAKTATTELDAPEISFAQLLGQLTGTQTTETGEAATDVMEGMSWREVQTGMMFEAIGKLMNSERPVVTDPELANLLNMMKQLMSQDGTVDVGELEQLFEQMKKRLEKLMEENGAQMAGLEALALLNGMMDVMPRMPMTDPALQALGNESGESVLELMLDSQPNELLSLLNGGQPMAQDSVAQVDYQQVAQTPEELPQVEQSQAASAHAGESRVDADGLEADVVQMESKTAPQAATASDFESAVRNAKQQMDGGQTTQQTETEPEDDSKDFEAMQQRVNDGTYLRNTAAANTNPQVQAPEMQHTPEPVAVQLEQGITAGVARGADEFSITLKPAELGEVTIRLNRTEDGLTMSIVTKSAETQKLLAGELNALKESLKPLNVEVETIVTERQDALLNGQNGFGGHNQRDWNMHGAAYYGDEPLGEGAEVEILQPVMAGVAGSALDTYI